METKVTSTVHPATVLALLAIIASASAYALIARPSARAEASGKQEYEYFYEVDADGDAQVMTRFLDETLQEGSSWVIVPTFVAWQNRTSGSLLSSDVQPLVTEGVVNPFWANYSFTYLPRNGSFDLRIGFNVSQYAYIIEPNGFFFSSEIEFDPSAKGSLTVDLPNGTEVSSSNVRLVDYIRGNVVTPEGLSVRKLADGRLRVVASAASHSRLAVAMTLPGKTVEKETLTVGRFSSQTPRRYAARTGAILELYNRSYPILRDLFDVDLTNVNFTFFIPTIDQFLSGLGGFVPFTAEDHPGAVNVNMFYFRTMEGFIEIIALHELVHHFVWEVGIPPDKLWVHEGMAQYASIEVAKLLGYQAGAKDQEETIRSRAKSLDGQLGFVQSWAQDQASDYVASYMVFKILGDEHGGIGFYEKAFRALKTYGDLRDDSSIVTALGIAAANTTGVVREFQSWGFTNIVDVVELKGLLDYAEKSIPEVSPFLQPYKAAAQWTLSWAENAYSRGRYSLAFGYLNTSMFYAENAFLLTLLTYTGVVAAAAALYWVYGQLAYKRARAPYGPPITTGHPGRGAMFCYQCGTRLPSSAVFCPECGTRRLQSTP